MFSVIFFGCKICPFTLGEGFFIEQRVLRKRFWLKKKEIRG
jgi:hypothetical protein